MMPILGSRFGAHAEYAVVHESMIAKLPPIDDDDMMIDEGDKTRMISFVEAASLPLISLTTMQAFSKLTSHTEGKKILIHAGAGGVGTFAIQYAKKVLHMYVATTASIEKAHFLKQLGADLVIDYRTTDFQSVIQDYDVVFDTMSWAYEEQTLASSRSKDDDKRVLKSNGGHYLNILSSDWGLTDGKEKANGFLMVRHFLYYKLCHLVPWWRETVPSYDIVVVKPNGKQLQKVLNLVHDGTIRPIIDQTFPLKDAVSAYQYLENGHASGKVVLEH
jgi:alcohol dehydrogenase